MKSEKIHNEWLQKYNSIEKQMADIIAHHTEEIKREKEEHEVAIGQLTEEISNLKRKEMETERLQHSPFMGKSSEGRNMSSSGSGAVAFC